MKYFKLIGFLAVGIFDSFFCFAQFDQFQKESNAPIIYSISESGRALRSGTFSNRTPNGANNSTAPKTWTFHDMTSWDSKYYDGKTFSNASITGGQPTTLTSATANFAPTDVGKEIEVFGAGPGGTNLITTIQSRNSSTQITLTAAASTTVTNAIIRYGSVNKRAYTEGHYTTYSNGNYEMNYRLLFPANYNQGETYKYPMIVFLHGAGERGNCWNGSCFYSPGGTTSRSDGSVTVGSNILNSPGAAFTTNDVNKLIRINFGPGNANVDTRITAVNSATQVVLLDYSSLASNNRSFTYGYGSDNQYRNNDLNLVHGGQVHLEAVYNPTTGSNGKKAEDPTLNPRAWPGFVLIPQNQDGWNGSNQYEQAWRIIDLMIGAYNIDPDRIYMHGLSNGAAATWEVMRARPDLITALLPMSATISPSAEIFNSEVSKAVRIPAWIFQGGVDGAPTPNNTNQLVAKLKAAGGLPRYTIYPTVGHGTWGIAYSEPDFFTWMLKKTKRDIQILYGDSTLCATDNSGVTLALGTGFLAYQWERDGVLISGASGSTYNATLAGRYRARFSRISATPNEAQWNAWSKPVNIRETPAITPTITAVGTSHLPDINGGNLVRINGPTTKDLTKNWYVNGTLSPVNNNFLPTTNLDTANYTLRNTAGRVSLKTIPLNACSSLESNSIFVTTSTPITLAAPATPTAQTTAPGTIQLLWTDNTPDETGFEVYRSPNGNPNSYNFFKLLPEGSISYTDTGLTPGITYFYQLRAVNNTAVSPYTGNISAMAGSDTQSPSAPQNLTFTNRTLTSITLSWTASTDNVGVSAYTVFYGSTTVPTNSNNTTFTLTGLSGNSNYLITVKAVDLAGNISSASNLLTASTIFSGLNYSYSATNVDLLTDAGNNWNTPEVTGTRANFNITPRGQDDFFNFKFEGYIFLPAGSYNFRSSSDDGSRIYMGAQGASAYPFNAASPSTNLVFDNDGLHGCSPGGATPPTISFDGLTARPITVIMFEKQGGECLVVEYKLSSSGTWITIPDNILNSGSAPTLTPPLPPTGLSASATGMSSINLNWIAASGANSYEIYRSQGSSTSYSIIATSATTTFSDTGLTPNTTYNYKLKSVSNTNGSSASFSLVSSTATDPDSQAPTIPASVVVISSNYTNASFQWDIASDNVSVVGYKVFANGNLLGTSLTTTYYTTALTPGTNYNITVSAYDATGNESAQSIAANFNTTSASIFYSKPSSDLSQLSSWTQNSNGTGGNPPSFAYNGQYFTIQNPQTITSALTIGGNVSRVIVNDGVTVDINQPLTGTLRVGSGSTVNINANYQPVFETVATNSTVNFNASVTTIPLTTYGNLTVNGSSLKNIGSGTLQVLGNLTLGNGAGIKGAPSNTSTISVAGDLITGSSILQPASDNEVALQFTGSGPHAITGVSHQFFYKVGADAGATVTFNNTSGSPKSLNLGSPNGGGIDLANGSSLLLGTNNLVLTDKAAVNPTTNTGAISINTGSIQLTTTANSDANFYFAASPNNRVTNFTMQENGSGTVQIRQPIEIYDVLKINGGTLTANGNVTLKSSATSSASIQQIVNGNISGNVVVERYMSPKRVYRYLSTPVAGTKIADWQNYFPITGSFTGASTGTGLSTNPSVFIYNETLGLGQAGYTAYPTTDNQASIVPGRGYTAFVREGTNPTTLVNTGLPNQGNFNFTPLLTGGTGQSTDGWNLLGNPYACDLVWSNNGWTFSGVGNVLWIRENLTGGGYQWRTFDRSGSGGIIPAGQAFWVQTSNTSPALTVTEAAKSTISATGVNNNFYRSDNDAPSNLFSISINDGTYQDNAYVKLTEDGSDNYDKLKDGFKNKNSFFNISTGSADKVDLAVNDLSNTFCDKIIPVNLATINPGSYTLQFDNLDNFSLANIQLIDSLTSTTSTITTSSPQYTINVSADASTYKNRLFLKLSRPAIMTNNLITSSKDVFCRSEEMAIVEVKNSQSGVVYQAISSTNTSLSAKVIGTGENIQLSIPVKDLAANQNVIRVQSSFSGCSSVVLANSKTISISELPTLAIESNVNGCLGSTVDLRASSNGTTYEWRNENSNQVLSETGNKLHVSIVNPITSFRASSFNASGCKSESKVILVRADSLDTPSISLVEGMLTTNASKSVQWMLDGVAINGAISNSYLPTASGSYSVQAKNTFCTRVSQEYLVTAIEDISNQSFFLTVYPNPSDTGFITIAGSTNSSEPMQLQIVDLMGKQLLGQAFSPTDYSKGIAVEQHLFPGVYLVKVTQSGKAAYQKIVIR